MGELPVEIDTPASVFFRTDVIVEIDLRRGGHAGLFYRLVVHELPTGSSDLGLILG
jgi:hypothetical protein